MMRGARLAGGVFAMLACTPSAPVVRCPDGFAADPRREERMLVLLKSSPEGPDPKEVSGVCFGPSRSLGVLAGGRPLLDANASDGALAARLSHLAVHKRDGIGDGCAHGLAAALRSEDRARAAETAHRARLGLGPLPVGTDDAAVDYAARCGAP
jgi:hypothetical protein